MLLAYRLRDVERRGAEVVLARSADGERFETVGRLDKDRFGAESLERPALVRTDAGRRLYVCCATPDSKHWWIGALDAPSLDALPAADARTVFAGDERTGVKDPVVRRAGGRWHAWICCHPLDVPGEEDRMTTAYATSADGLAWEWHGTVLAPRPGAWDARGTRVTAVLPDGRAYYDGRATKEENFSERTGLAEPGGGGRLRALGDAPVAGYRYLDVLGDRLYYGRRSRTAATSCAPRSPAGGRSAPCPWRARPRAMRSADTRGPSGGGRSHGQRAGSESPRTQHDAAAPGGRLLDRAAQHGKLSLALQQPGHFRDCNGAVWYN